MAVVQQLAVRSNRKYEKEVAAATEVERRLRSAAASGGAGRGGAGRGGAPRGAAAAGAGTAGAGGARAPAAPVVWPVAVPAVSPQTRSSTHADMAREAAAEAVGTLLALSLALQPGVVVAPCLRPCETALLLAGMQRVHEAGVPAPTSMSAARYAKLLGRTKRQPSAAAAAAVAAGAGVGAGAAAAAAAAPPPVACPTLITDLIPLGDLSERNRDKDGVAATVTALSLAVGQALSASARALSEVLESTAGGGITPRHWELLQHGTTLGRARLLWAWGASVLTGSAKDIKGQAETRDLTQQACVCARGGQPACDGDCVGRSPCVRGRGQQQPRGC